MKKIFTEKIVAQLNRARFKQNRKSEREMLDFYQSVPIKEWWSVVRLPGRWGKRKFQI